MTDLEPARPAALVHLAPVHLALVGRAQPEQVAPVRRGVAGKARAVEPAGLAAACFAEVKRVSLATSAAMTLASTHPRTSRTAVDVTSRVRVPRRIAMAHARPRRAKGRTAMTPRRVVARSAAILAPRSAATKLAVPSLAPRVPHRPTTAIVRAVATIVRERLAQVTWRCAQLRLNNIACSQRARDRNAACDPP